MAPTRREDLVEDALEAAQRAGATYVEARMVHRLKEVITFRDGMIETSSHLSDLGIGVRALAQGGWGYAATNLLGRASVRRAAARAVEAAAATRRRADAKTPSAVTGSYETPLTTDPMTVPLERKVAHFAAAHAAMKETPGVAVTKGSFVAHRLETTFRATNGTAFDQSVTLSGGGTAAIARGDDGSFQQRSTPKGFEGNVLQGGYELFEAMDLVSESRRAAREAVALVKADPAPAGETTIILDGAQLSLQIHESVGHPTELDRVMGEEISLAGGSFLRPEALEGLRYGSDLVTLTADATSPRGPGTFAFDDEGTPATRTTLVDRGRFTGFLSGRDEAARIDRPSASCLRADSWSGRPIVRMINLNLEPGSGSLDDLIGGVDDGLLMSVNKSWSIDDLRLNFQFSCEAAYEIKGGQRTGRLFRNPIYSGVTPRFWQSCTGIAGPEAWQMWGWMFCGKGDPVQLMYVGHGCAPARFEGVHVWSS